ncbi:MAG: hypothetical protein PHX74_00660 [Candidatus Sumerlaeales bacterium]|nr:hypothetical protein [Candidatus Sumerlaeales bacterium]
MGKNPNNFEDDDLEAPQNSCKDCKYFDVDREAGQPAEDFLCMCIHPDLEEYELYVSGDSGCSLFEAFSGDDDDDEVDEEDDE